MAKMTDKELKAGHKAEIKELKAGHKAEIKELKAGLKSEIKELKSELKNAQKTTINVDKNENKISINQVIALHPIILEWLAEKPVGKQLEFLAQAINVGLLALMEGRVEGIISRINDDINEDLSLLVRKMQLLETGFHKSTHFNTKLEGDVCDALAAHANRCHWTDRISPSGERGGAATNKNPNKTGDIDITVIDDGRESKLVVEVKFNKSVAEGKFEDFKKAQGVKDTAWSQIIEARWNRGSAIGIFVVDKEKLHAKIKELTESVAYVPEIRGFVCVVDVLSNDYQNACIAYGLARTISLASRGNQFYEPGVLDFIIQRTQHTLRRRDSIKKISKSMVSDLVNSLTSLEKDLVYVDQALEFLQLFVDEYSRTGTLKAESMFALYSHGDVKEKEKIGGAEFKKLLDDAVKEAKHAALPPPTEEEVIEPETIEGDADVPEEANDEIDDSSMTNAQMKKLKKAELVELAKGKGVDSSGTKDDIIARLTATEDLPSAAKLKRMKKAELVELAENIGVDSNGTKDDIIGRLEK